MRYFFIQISHFKVYLFCICLSEAVMLAALPKYKLKYQRWVRMTQILYFPVLTLIDYLFT